VTEYRAQDVSELMQEMRASCIKITATAYSESGADPAYSSAPCDIVRSTWRKILKPFKEHVASPIIPSHDKGLQVTEEDVEAESAIPPTQTLLLLAGMHKSQDETYLTQDDVEMVETDRQLFCFMREQLNNRYNSLQRFFSTTRVKNIYFSKASDR